MLGWASAGSPKGTFAFNCGHDAVDLAGGGVVTVFSGCTPNGLVVNDGFWHAPHDGGPGASATWLSQHATSQCLTTHGATLLMYTHWARMHNALHHALHHARNAHVAI
jgi:hypothetical protein